MKLHSLLHKMLTRFLKRFYVEAHSKRCIYNRKNLPLCTPVFSLRNENSMFSFFESEFLEMAIRAVLELCLWHRHCICKPLLRWPFYYWQLSTLETFWSKVFCLFEKQLLSISFLWLKSCEPLLTFVCLHSLTGQKSQRKDQNKLTTAVTKLQPHNVFVGINTKRTTI